MRKTWLGIVALLALSAVAESSPLTGTSVTSLPQPLISGTVTAFSDRQLVVAADDGQQVELAMDSRTMVPADLAAGMPMRVQFRVMENGNYYAQRITPVRGEAGEALAAEIRNGYAGGESMAWNSEASQADAEATQSHDSEMDHTMVSSNDAAADAEAREQAEATDRNVLADNAEERAEGENLPQTASHQPATALLASIALGCAGVLAVARRRGTA